MMGNGNEWMDVPERFLKKWRLIFENNRNGINILENCPICDKVTLHMYYHINKYKERIINNNKYIAEGGLWYWCSSCKHYEHFSGFVPDWWKWKLYFEIKELSTIPIVLDKALKCEKPHPS